MFKKLIVITIMISSVSSVLHAMDDSAKQKGENWISAKLDYTEHALERMKERKITIKQIKHVLKTGSRTWDLEHDGVRQFTEKNNKLNPLIVVANTEVKPNIVITVFRHDLTIPKAMSIENSEKDAEYAQIQKANKNRDLIRQQTAKSRYFSKR